MKNKYLFIFLFIFIFLLIIIYTFSFNIIFIKYKNYIIECNQLKKFNNTNKNNNTKPYISICLPVYNMEKYIERALLSIINQSFQNFEIIIINDNSKDNTINIIKRMKLEDNRIKIINHNENKGVYSSRVEAVLNAKGEYILLMDPDDMLLNQKLFEELFNYNLKSNLDIIEFSVYHQIEKKKTIYFPNKNELNHYHHFDKNIIYQPQLSNIIFYNPKTKKYSDIICRTVWNKLIKKNILLKSINYIEKEFHNKYLITADDTPINIMNFQFANNYSNIFLPGYLYLIRKNSMSNGKNGKKHDIIVSINYLLYYKFFFRFIKEFKKDLNYLYYDLKVSSFYLLNLKKLKVVEYIPIAINLFICIFNEKNISKEFKDYIKKIILYFL